MQHINIPKLGKNLKLKSLLVPSDADEGYTSDRDAGSYKVEFGVAGSERIESRNGKRLFAFQGSLCERFYNGSFCLVLAVLITA